MEREGDAGYPVSGRRALGVLGAAPAERDCELLSPP